MPLPWQRFQPRSNIGIGTDFAEHETNSILDGGTRNLHKLVVVGLVSFYQSVIGADCLVEILLAFLIWLEDFTPRRGDENDMIVGKGPCGVAHMLGHRDMHQA